MVNEGWWSKSRWWGYGGSTPTAIRCCQGYSKTCCATIEASVGGTQSVVNALHVSRVFLLEIFKCLNLTSPLFNKSSLMLTTPQSRLLRGCSHLALLPRPRPSHTLWLKHLSGTRPRSQRDVKATCCQETPMLNVRCIECLPCAFPVLTNLSAVRNLLPRRQTR